MIMFSRQRSLTWHWCLGLNFILHSMMRQWCGGYVVVGVGSHLLWWWSMIWDAFSAASCIIFGKDDALLDLIGNLRCSGGHGWCLESFKCVQTFFDVTNWVRTLLNLTLTTFATKFGFILSWICCPAQFLWLPFWSARKGDANGWKGIQQLGSGYELLLMKRWVAWMNGQEQDEKGFCWGAHSKLPWQRQLSIYPKSAMQTKGLK